MTENVYPLNTNVTIDGRGKGTIIGHKSSTVGEIYTVLIDGIDFEVDLPAERLSLIQFPSKYFGQTTGNDRFRDVSEIDVTNIVANQKNKSTASKTFYDLKLLKYFMLKQEESREVHEIPPPELGPILCKFFVSVRKCDGTNYEPVSLRAFLGSFERHLRNKNYGHSVIHGIEFVKVREVLQAKMKELKSEGRGNKPQRAEPITDNEIEQLWETNQLGSSSPESIFNTLWFFNTVSFGLRGSDEHRDMCWGDVKLFADESGHEYLEFAERQTKTRQGSNPRDVRTVKPKMWANLTEPDKCPVNIYKLYASKRPVDYSNPTDPFYISTHTNQNAMKAGDQWFKRQPIGQNKLTSTMKRMASAAGLSQTKRLTNHSARKHLVQKLSENNVPANQIMQITGHRNIQSVNNYSHISEVQHKNISDILTNTQHPPHYKSIQLKAASSTTLNSSSQSSNYTFQGALNNMFAGNIFGGTFNINVNPANATTTDIQSFSSPKVSRKRKRVVFDRESD